MPYKDPAVRQAKAKIYSAHHHAINREERNRKTARRDRANPEAHKARTALYRSRHREKVRAQGRERMYLETERVKQRARQIRRLFGLTSEQYDEMEAAQQGLCAICQRPETRINRRSPDPTRWGIGRLAVDHDHDTGLVRGLLCSACNIAIGNLGNDPDRARAAARYLDAIKRKTELVTPPTTTAENAAPPKGTP